MTVGPTDTGRLSVDYRVDVAVITSMVSKSKLGYFIFESETPGF